MPTAHVASATAVSGSQRARPSAAPPAAASAGLTGSCRAPHRVTSSGAPAPPSACLPPPSALSASQQGRARPGCAPCSECFCRRPSRAGVIVQRHLRDPRTNRCCGPGVTGFASSARSARTYTCCSPRKRPQCSSGRRQRSGEPGECLFASGARRDGGAAGMRCRSAPSMFRWPRWAVAEVTSLREKGVGAGQEWTGPYAVALSRSCAVIRIPVGLAIAASASRGA